MSCPPTRAVPLVGRNEVDRIRRTVLLPDAPQPYRDDCVKGLIQIVKDSDDDEEDVDGEEGDDQDAEPEDEAGTS